MSLSGDDSTLIAEIYDAHSGELLHVAYKVLGNREKAEDALQAAFVRVMDHMDAIRKLPGHKRLPYIVVVVRNQAINDYHRGKRRQGISLDQLAPVLPAGDDVEQEVIRSAEFRSLRGRIKELPDELRLPLLLRYGEEQPYRNISALLGISEALARKRVQRALDRLGGRERR